MIELKGKYNYAKVFIDTIDNETISQIVNLLNQDFIKDSKIRIMPDCHAGAGCVIGFTADLGDKVIPNIVGVDIGCGVLTVELGKQDLNLEKINDIINKYIPSGYNYHDEIKSTFKDLEKLHCYKKIKGLNRIEKSIGTLGGGNHFIEINEDKNKNKYLVIHSGSRNLGKQVAEFYQNIAIQDCSNKEEFETKKKQLIENYKKQNKSNQIEKDLKKLKQNITIKYPKELCFLTGENREKYLHDMDICQKYANLNREVMASIIVEKYFNKHLNNFNHFHTIHNYISFKDNIIRKGSIAAYKNDKVLIPINMRDGSILAIGKGNEDWNYSAPHGAGRIMSRSQAKKEIKIEDFKNTMKDVYSTSISINTLDEAPMAYKPINDILNNIKDTIDIIDVIKPIYNFKHN